MRADAWPDVRDADELHDALFTLVAVPERIREAAIVAAAPARSGTRCSRARFPNGAAIFDELAAERRATRALYGGRAYWVCAERAAALPRNLPGRAFETRLAR